jgi:hypothetical protein
MEKWKMNEKAYNLLVTMATSVASAVSAELKAKNSRQGAYDSAAEAAALCIKEAQGDMTAAKESFLAVYETLEDNIRHNRDNLAVRTRAEKREKPDRKTGARYKVPASIQVAKSTLKSAFELGAAIILTDEKSGKTEVRSFSAIREENSVIREAREKAKMENATGVEKLRYDIRRDLQTVLERVGKASESELVTLSKALRAWIEPPKAETSGDKLAEAMANVKAKLEAEPAKGTEGRSRRNKQQKKAA